MEKHSDRVIAGGGFLRDEMLGLVVNWPVPFDLVS